MDSPDLQRVPTVCVLRRFRFPRKTFARALLLGCDSPPKVMIVTMNKSNNFEVSLFISCFLRAMSITCKKF